MMRWQLAHAGLSRCIVICSRRLSTRSGPSTVSSSAGTLGGGSGGGVPRMFSSTQTPRLTGDVRLLWTQVTDKKLPCPSSPRR